MDDKARNRIEARLQEERERAMRMLRTTDEAAAIGTDEDGDLTRYPMHPADQGTDTMDQEQALALLSAESARLALIDDAMLRLAKEPEKFGRCETCGSEISVDRLDLVPWARFCVDHQAEQEGGAGA